MHRSKDKLLIYILISLFCFSFAKAQEWKKLITEDRIEVYAGERQEGIIPFKAMGEIDYNIKFILQILKDYQAKPSWVPKLSSVKLHHEISQTKYIFSEYYKTPWPASDREFLLEGTIKEEADRIFLQAKSIENLNLMHEDYIQADVSNLSLILERVNDHKTKISFEFHGDMKGWMPNWLVNIIQKKWPLAFIKALRKRAAEVSKLKES